MITECLYCITQLASHTTALDPPMLVPTIAYLDPGTGSLVIQTVIGTLVGGLVSAKVFWKRVVGFWKNLRGGAKREHAGN